MRFPLALLLVLFVADIAADCFIYNKLKTLERFKWLKTAHITVSAIFCILLGVIGFLLLHTTENTTFVFIMWAIFVFWSAFIPKLLYTTFGIVSNIPKLFRQKTWKYIHTAGIAVALATFAAMWWGAIFTTRQLDIKNVEISSSKLPKSFDGYRIALFSDLHTGTFGNSVNIVEQVVKRINELSPDLIVFAGDIVNRKTSELRPFIPTLKKLCAKDGVYSVLGNHDYGDYYSWETPSQKEANHKEMLSIQKDSLGWILLSNEHRLIYRQPDSIAVIGVENWGEPPFSTYGNLSRSYPDLHDNRYKLLISHNPEHWDKVVRNTSNIDLTLSGHTHGMQLILSAGENKISPASIKYKHWGGLYRHQNSVLYVNIGIGEVGIPMRIGATPEITLITLRSTTAK